MHPSNHFYGHADVLAQACGLASTPPIWGLLQHGWNPDRGIRDTGWLPSWFPKLVWNRRALDLARSDGTPRVRAVGAPFLYLRRSSIPVPDAGDAVGTIAFPYHGWEGQPTVRNDDRLAAQMAEREDGPVTVCLYWFDHDRTEIRRAYEQHGFTVITMGRRDDPTFLTRQFATLAGHRRVVTNRVSTALWYGAALGREVEVYGEVFGPDSPAEAVAFGRQQRDRWPEITDGPIGGADAIALGDRELGGDLLLDRNDLIDALGWRRGRRSLSRVARTGSRVLSAARHRRRAPIASRPFTIDTTTDVRDLDVVVPTVGRDSTRTVVTDRIAGERRLARLTVVAQDCAPVLDDALATTAARTGVELRERSVATRIGCARARALGTTDTEAGWVGFVDDDIAFLTGSLSDLVDEAEARGWAGACGVVVDDDRNRPTHRLGKRVLFHGIFRDPRQRALVADAPLESPVLSGGLTVFRADVYREVAPLAERFVGYSWGEDVTLSFAASRRHRLGIVPAVRVANLTHGNAEAAATPAGVAAERHRSYRRFAELYATRRRDWLAYAGVTVGAGAQGLAEAGPAAALPLVATELGRAARGVWRP